MWPSRGGGGLGGALEWEEDSPPVLFVSFGGEAVAAATTSLRLALDAPREAVRSALYLTGAAFCGDPKQMHFFLRYAWPERPLHARPKPRFFFRGTMAALACAHQFLWKVIILFTGSTAGGAPSGLLPGGGAGSRTARSSRSGGEDWGLDHVFHLSPKGFSKNLLALSVKPLSQLGHGCKL